LTTDKYGLNEWEEEKDHISIPVRYINNYKVNGYLKINKKFKFIQ